MTKSYLSAPLESSGIPRRFFKLSKGSLHRTLLAVDCSTSQALALVFFSVDFPCLPAGSEIWFCPLITFDGVAGAGFIHHASGPLPKAEPFDLSNSFFNSDSLGSAITTEHLPIH